MTMTDSLLLRMEAISKSFPGVQALQDVTFEVEPGEIHALVGENGAGKSTLMKALTGGQPATSGRIFWRGKEVDIHTPNDAHLGEGRSVRSQNDSSDPRCFLEYELDRLALRDDWPPPRAEVGALWSRKGMYMNL